MPTKWQQKNEKEIASLHNEIEEMKEINQNFIKEVDDQVNRSMRNTLIFRDIPEDKNENWE